MTERLSGLVRNADGHLADIETDGQQHLAMLRILYGASTTALDAFRAADNPIDRELVVDLERMVERTSVEIERLAEGLANASLESDRLSGARAQAARARQPSGES